MACNLDTPLEFFIKYKPVERNEIITINYNISKMYFSNECMNGVQKITYYVNNVNIEQNFVFSTCI
jgi:hypothetical protein